MCGKPVEGVTTEYSNRLSACSACAGEYEDPDRTARSTNEEPDEDEEWDAVEDFLPGAEDGQE